ncbi:sensor histidine kinase [Agromyces sp. NPDC056965]|uniref:sensor histidine kinase n=1 Tax=Agromyces sp. NPDC056965 TaxID=3345983 RepID=UPI003628B8D9
MTAVATAGAGTAFIAIGLTNLWSDAAWAPDISPWWHLIPILVGSALMLGKRRRPATMLFAGTVVAGVDIWLGGSLGMVLVYFDLLYSAVLFGRARVVRALLVVIAVLVAAAFVAPLLSGSSLQAAMLLALQAFLLLGTPYWWGMSVRRSRELAALSDARARDAERFASIVKADTVREERGRMARDLHDVIAGNLSAIAINAEAALSSKTQTHDRAALRAIREASIDGLDEMRSMILVLRSGTDPLIAPPRLAELPDLVARSPAVNVTFVGDTPHVPTAIDQALARIVGEGLSNAARHAPGADVEIRFRATEAETGVSILSRGGTPAAPTIGTGHGIGLLRERAELLGGTLSAAPVEGGWRLDAQIPRSAQ